ncbi:zinc chelation protein SecC [Leucobacter viscericola]|uniref:Zinc chelation protein SecC n=1 Tax=Leucobacter viscericola TaxID=2714935 RepID=A0A6G7XCF4_9MICO|nr:YchJ family metal-binding protein [Leucobacter viscericola]QIK62274.1 zinc chelation protein SecC [Leucobacter viscericola]
MATSDVTPAAGSLCPCGRGEPYASCCGSLHSGGAAPTAERLMRSRYSAFVLGLDAYLLQSWHSSTRPQSLELDPQVEWRRLVIEQTTAGGPFDSDGEVTFTAIARTPDGRMEQRERSRFVRDEQGRWSYLDGVAL